MVAMMGNALRRTSGVPGPQRWPLPRSGQAWNLQSWSRPAGPVGGDFVEAQWRGDVLRVWVGDVTGHGLEAARAAARIRRVLRRFFGSPATPEMLRQASAELYAALQGERFLTVTVIECAARSNRVTILNAGNPSVVVCRAGDDTLETISSTGMPLGLVDAAEWQPPQPVEVRLGPGDQLLCFTDGLPDEPGRRGRFGLGRVIRTLRQGGANVVETLAERLGAFSGRPRPGFEPDDVTVLCLARRASLTEDACPAWSAGRYCRPGFRRPTRGCAGGDRLLPAECPSSRA